MSMEKETVTVARPFNNEGTFVRPGVKIKVDQARAIELEGNHLVIRAGAKAAPTPQNKKAPDPANKRAPAPSNKGAAQGWAAGGAS